MKRSPMLIVIDQFIAALEFVATRMSHRAISYAQVALVLVTTSVVGQLANATDIAVNSGWSYEVTGATTVIHVDRITNKATSGTSGTLRLRLVAFAWPYDGSNVWGWIMADYTLPPLAAGQTHSTITSGAIAMDPPPVGIWYTTLYVDEDNKGWSRVATLPGATGKQLSCSVAACTIADSASGSEQSFRSDPVASLASLSTDQAKYVANSGEVMTLSGMIQAGADRGALVDVYVAVHVPSTTDAALQYLGPNGGWTNSTVPIISSVPLVDVSAPNFIGAPVDGLPVGNYEFILTVTRAGKSPYGSNPDIVRYTISRSQIVDSASTTLALAGRVVKGPVIGATVTFFALNANGTVGALLGTTVTDAFGDFNVSLVPAPTTPFLAQATGGTYVDEATGVTETLLSTDRLTAVLPAGTQEAAITPLTDMAATRARVMAASGTPLATAVRAANAGVARQYNLIDILGVLPVAANDAAQVAAASREQRNYGVVLAGIAQQAASLDVRPIDLAAALATDLADGVLDGLGEDLYGSRSGNRFAATVVRVPTIYRGVIALPPSAGTAELQRAIDTFVASKNNLTNLAGKTISIQPVNISPAGTDFYITATALPAWTEGTPGTATLTANGGTPPYVWTATPGSALPSWLALGQAGNNGVLTGTPPLLAGGSTMSISPPFSITVTDNSVPAQAQAIQLTVSIVKAPPDIHVAAGVCIAGTPINPPIQVATATGGVPPYYFRSPSLASGAPPFGTSVWTDGTLRGTCPRPGVYAFFVIAIDSIGADPPKDTTLTAIEYSISPTAVADTSQGGSGSITINGTGGAGWTATSNASWISITAGSKGSGNGTTTYSVSANTSASSRTATLTVAEKTFTVTQASSSASNPYQGQVTGRWQGTCPAYYNAPVSGTFSLNIAPDGSVTGSYSGNNSGGISGSVSGAGVLAARGAGGGGVSWSGTFYRSGGNTAGSGTWDDGGYCSGTWTAP